MAKTSKRNRKPENEKNNMLIGVYTDTVSPHNLFYLSLFGFGGMKTRVDRYNITKE